MGYSNLQFGYWSRDPHDPNDPRGLLLISSRKDSLREPLMADNLHRMRCRDRRIRICRLVDRQGIELKLNQASRSLFSRPVRVFSRISTTT